MGSETLVTIIGFSGTFIASLVAAFLGVLNRGKIQEVHLTLNSRLDQWKKESAEAATAAVLSAYKEGATTRPESKDV